MTNISFPHSSFTLLWSNVIKLIHTAYWPQNTSLNLGGNTLTVLGLCPFLIEKNMAKLTFPQSYLTLPQRNEIYTQCLLTPTQIG